MRVALTAEMMGAPRARGLSPRAALTRCRVTPPATLKGLGNSLLGHFGMSLDNFKAVQDPVTGSYSLSYGAGGAEPPPQPPVG